jgi:hypothetical protein
VAGVVVGVRVVVGVDGDVAAVHARAERPVTRRREDDGPNGGVGLDRVPHRREVVLHLRVEAVVDLGTVQRDDGDALVLAVQQGFELHWWLLGRVACDGAEATRVCSASRCRQAHSIKHPTLVAAPADTRLGVRRAAGT